MPAQATGNEFYSFIERNIEFRRSKAKIVGSVYNSIEKTLANTTPLGYRLVPHQRDHRAKEIAAAIRNLQSGIELNTTQQQENQPCPDGIDCGKPP